MAPSSSLKQEIAAAFQGVNHPSLPSSILSQIAALSTSLRLSPSKLAEAWEAHSLTKDVMVLDDASFKGYHTAVTKDASGAAASAKKKNVAVMTGTGLGKRREPGSNVTPSPMAKRATTTTAATNNATTTTPAAATPAANADGKNARDGLSAIDNLTTPHGSGRGAASSPSGKKTPGSAGSSSAMVITPPKLLVSAPKTPKYSERTNAGMVVQSYNPHDLPSALEARAVRTEGTSAAETQRLETHVAAAISQHPSASHPTGSYRHMFTSLEKRSGALEDRLFDMNNAICDKYKIKDEDQEMIEAVDGIKSEDNGLGTWVPVGLPKQNKVLCVGRICNEAHEGKINRTSIRLEGSRQHSAGSRIHLDLQGLNKPTETNPEPQSYSFFPGQIVAVEGINSSGRTMQASGLLEGAAPTQETMAPSKLLDLHYGAKAQDGMPLSIMSLCGPFTMKDNLDYDPLVDAILQVTTDKPDVVIMCGPFVDCRHTLVAGGEPTITNDDGVEQKVSYEALFATRISGLLEEMYGADPELKTQFVLVPSMDDAFLDAVYPQPPLEDIKAGLKLPKGVAGDFGELGLSFIEQAGREDVKKNQRSKRVHCVSNPCTLRINDVTVGVTSTDVVFHIASDETNANLPGGTRLQRIAQHLIQQRSYYPLFPAAKGASMDLAKMKEWEMPVQPDILITPSKLTNFARKVLDTTVVVNPGHLTKGTAGGTYAMMDVHPMKKEDLEKALDGDNVVKGVQDRLRVDIKRI